MKSSNENRSWPSASWMGLLILGPIVLFYAIVLGRQWVPVHDTLQGLYWAHELASGLFFEKQIPLWAPYINWGRSTNLIFAMCVPPSFVLLSPLFLFLKAHVVTVFYLGLFLEEVLLLVGTYLFSRRIFSRWETVVFTCLAMAGGVCWSNQLYLNFHLYYGLPLVFYFLHRFFDEREWKYFFWGALVFGITSGIGNGYNVILLLPVFFVVFGALWWGSGRPTQFSKAQSLLPFVLALLLGISLVSLISIGGFPQALSEGRAADGSASYASFLTWGRDVSFNNFSGILSGLTASINTAVYGGLLLFPLIVVALIFSPLKGSLPFWMGASFLFLLYLAQDSFVAPLMFHVPGFKYFRYLTLVTPVIKMFLVFLAAYGFDVLVDSKRSIVMTLLACLLLVLSFVIFQFDGGIRPWVSLVGCSLLCLLCLRALVLGNQFRGFLTFLLLIMAIDLFSFRSSFFHSRMLEVPKETWDLFYPRKIEFTERVRELPKTLSAAAMPLFDSKMIKLYDIQDQFLNIDPCRHQSKSDLAERNIALLGNREGFCTKSKLRVVDIVTGESIVAQIQVEDFSFSGIKVSVQNLSDSKNAALLYEDAWHPFWKGSAEPFGPFKIYRLIEGTQTIELKARSKWIQGLGLVLWGLLMTPIIFLGCAKQFRSEIFQIKKIGAQPIS